MTDTEIQTKPNGCLAMLFGVLSFIVVVLLVHALRPVETRNVIGGLSSKSLGFSYFSSIPFFVVLHLIASGIGHVVSRRLSASRTVHHSVIFVVAIAINILWLSSVLPYSSAKHFFRHFAVDPVPESVTDLQVEGGFGFEALLRFRFRIATNDFSKLLAAHPFTLRTNAPSEAFGINNPEWYWNTNGGTVNLLADETHETIVWLWRSD